MPVLSVIIVSYNTREITLECLKRIRADEIIVVDNASSDGSVEEIKKRYKDIRILQNKTNVGFAAANNQGMKIAKGDKILLLNSDCFVNTDTLDKIQDSMFKIQSDVIGCRLLNKDGSVQQSWGYFPSLRRITLMMLFIDNLPIIRKFIDSIHVRDVARYEKEQEVDWVTGAFVMFKREVFEKVGGIDEKYFMYGEEMEWMYRIKQAGFKVWYSPVGSATHLLGASSSNRAPAVVGEMRGWIYWFSKHNPVWQQRLLPYVILFGCLLRIVLKPKLSSFYRQAISEIFAPTKR
ncbi:MAG: glycosyltransferase [Microgenomates group bacterium Gr01-1014_16]|nr:MAG: glycosyltransferase [Microgenomates group bacterium Gr01-1014_16]